MTAPFRLLVFSDLSWHADNAIRRASLIAEALGATAEVVQVFPVITTEKFEGFYSDINDARDKARSLLRQRLQTQVQRCWRTDAKFPEVQVLDGNIIATLSRHLDSSRPDLVVIGANGTGVLERNVIGTTALRLLRQSKTPILVVKQQVRSPYERVLAPVDFSTASTTTVHLASKIAPLAALALLAVQERGFDGIEIKDNVDSRVIAEYEAAQKRLVTEDLNKFTDRLQWRRSQITKLVNLGDPREKILVAERELDTDLIVMGKHGLGFIDQLLIGSVTEHILFNGRADMLVVPTIF